MIKKIVWSLFIFSIIGLFVLAGYLAYDSSCHGQCPRNLKCFDRCFREKYCPHENDNDYEQKFPAS